MTPAQVAEVFGTMATAAVIVIVAVAMLWLVAPARLATLRQSLAGLGLALAGAIALIATAGSLWFSEGADFPPCELCWYQRIAMYPLAVLLPVAAARTDRSVRPYALLVAGIGLSVSAWHNLIETVPSLSGDSCDPTNPCTIRWVEAFGFWTIPRLAFVAFSLIITMLLLDPDPKDAT